MVQVKGQKTFNEPKISFFGSVIQISHIFLKTFIKKIRKILWLYKGNQQDSFLFATIFIDFIFFKFCSPQSTKV